MRAWLAEALAKAAILAFLVLYISRSVMSQELSTADVLKLPVPKADQRIPYGTDGLQFGDLRLPSGATPAPVVVVIHGGCWLSAFNLDHISSLSAALTRSGAVTWTIEYRRVGNAGGGWPGTFEDISHAVDHLRTLASSHPLDLDRVVVLGHSAGGHLALWVAARSRLPKESPLYVREPLRVRGVVALAPIPDLKRAALENVCDGAAIELMGGAPEKLATRYDQASPASLLPLGVPVRVLHGKIDRLVPVELSFAYAAAARAKGDDVTLTLIPEAGHFEPIVPTTKAWPSVEAAVWELLKRPR